LLSDEIQLLLKRFKKKGGGFALQAENELDVNLNDFSVVFNLVGKDVFMEEKGEKKIRFSIRPAFSQCTE
jgi:SOS-response transcriptional repressor LexA